MRDILIVDLERDPERISLQSSLADDLELDSLALIELRQIIEDRFSTQIPEVCAVGVRTVDDLIELVEAIENDRLTSLAASLATRNGGR